MKNNILSTADILLPKRDFEKWAVIACDQFTSQPEYWEEVGDYTHNYPSTLKMIFPEAFLVNGKKNSLSEIVNSMNSYLDNDVFNVYPDSMIYVVRTLPSGKKRRGIVAAVNLDYYDYMSSTQVLIRPTEETVPDRVPPRVEIRRNAPLELPHVMIFADNPSNDLFDICEKYNLDTLYDFDLMMGGGHITGKLINSECAEKIDNIVSRLVDESHGKPVFAVGDGNHSLAAAKKVSEISPKEKTKYALAEIVNIYDESICFEPIYRVIKNADVNDILDNVKSCFSSCEKDNSNIQFYCNGRIYYFKSSMLDVKEIQDFIDKYLAVNTDVRIDYIHGEKDFEKLCSEPTVCGFKYKGITKDSLFEDVYKNGVLPRKTFSMGTAKDKRYYLECRKIKD